MASLNHLKDEKSPYLKQHADNPVDWYPWGEEAFAEAERRDLPIFLSIGYSTCHWCHVMEEESFSDEETAALINQYFVAVKVDREERPDIDKLYMDACKAMTGGGGWPLTIFMTADKKPFYASTYLPKEDKYGRKGLLSILPEIHNLWVNQREKLLLASDNVVSHLKKKKDEESVELDEELLEKTAGIFEKIYDQKYHGFGREPKFPMAHYITFLLQHWNTTKKDKYMDMIQNTLKTMRAGGIFDQLGRGFHRYSTDREWEIPHFEKMLYDQALLIYVYIEAFQASRDRFYSDTAEEVIEYLFRDMAADGGCFYAAEDADSEGVEGKYYFWDKDELQELLSEEEYSKLLELYEVQDQKRVVLKLKDPKDYDKIESIKEKLLNIREKRIRPDKDKKILADWNGLVTAALAKAGSVLNKKVYIDRAEKTAKFIFDKMQRSTGRIGHSYCDGSISEIDNLNDYAYFLWGLIELHQATLNDEYLIKAEKIADTMFEHFWDQKEGGFYFTAAENDELFIRQKKAEDSAVPSANSIAAYNILRLSQLKDNFDYREKVGKILSSFSADIEDSPANHIFMLLAFHYLENPFIEVNIYGDLKDNAAQELLHFIRNNYQPRVLLDFHKKDGKTEFSICRDFVCGKKTENAEEIMSKLKE